MALKLRLMRDDEVLLEIPLEQEDEAPRGLVDAFPDLQDEVNEVLGIHKVLANQTRSRLLFNVVKGFDRRFSELMVELDANQKVLTESLQAMLGEGLLSKVEKNPREVHYRASQKGIAALMACFAMGRILREVE